VLTLAPFLASKVRFSALRGSSLGSGRPGSPRAFKPWPARRPHARTSAGRAVRLRQRPAHRRLKLSDAPAAAAGKAPASAAVASAAFASKFCCAHARTVRPPLRGRQSAASLPLCTAAGPKRPQAPRRAPPSAAVSRQRQRRRPSSQQQQLEHSTAREAASRRVAVVEAEFRTTLLEAGRECRSVISLRVPQPASLFLSDRLCASPVGGQLYAAQAERAVAEHCISELTVLAAACARTAHSCSCYARRTREEVRGDEDEEAAQCAHSLPASACACGWGTVP
jgi:hypothetical protein